ncbi:hypothetical protein B0J11DRAFT_525789 [Dendryphion nanum]|uniref:Uncharacterized protein n=1 Tax=Dendryphion nanum TaxID=256645 RepID=A0A9P9E0T0_9PLEO|nr:hypothetical protein B0J11DRAFT_525789 [Dendryphion nanum]
METTVALARIMLTYSLANLSLAHFPHMANRWRSGVVGHLLSVVMAEDGLVKCLAMMIIDEALRSLDTRRTVRNCHSTTSFFSPSTHPNPFRIPQTLPPSLTELSMDGLCQSSHFPMEKFRALPSLCRVRNKLTYTPQPHRTPISADTTTHKPKQVPFSPMRTSRTSSDFVPLFPLLKHDGANA